MFGYCADSKCEYDIWCPVPNSTAIENRAFSAYCKHTTECDSVVERIAAGDVHIVLDDDFNEDDIDYIKEQLQNKYGIIANLSFN